MGSEKEKKKSPNENTNSGKRTDGGGHGKKTKTREIIAHNTVSGMDTETTETSDPDIAVKVWSVQTKLIDDE